MPKRRRQEGKKRGCARMVEFGYRQCQVWFAATEAEAVSAAAEREGLRLATWVRRVAVHVAGEQRCADLTCPVCAAVRRFGSS